MSTAPPMASAIMTNWNRLRMAVSRASWCSMASTSASMAATNSSAAYKEALAVGGGSPAHRLRCTDHSWFTATKRPRTPVSQGTNSGREGSPVRSNSRLWSNCPTKANTSVRGKSACKALASRQACMRMRPASLTEAAPPSSCQVTHNVRPIDMSATTSRLAPMRISLVDREAARDLDMRKLCAAGSRAPQQGLEACAGGRCHRRQHLRIRGLVPCQQAGRGHGLGTAIPVAGVLHQEQFGREGEGLGLLAALGTVVHRIGNCLGMEGKRLAQVERGRGKQGAGKVQRDGQLADPGERRVFTRKLGGKGLELVAQLDFLRIQKTPYLGLALGIGLAQCAQVALGQAFHEFFDVVTRQVVAQQANATALVAVFEHPHAHHQRGKNQKVHRANKSQKSGGKAVGAECTRHGKAPVLCKKCY